MNEKIKCVNGDVLRWARLQCGNLQLKSIENKINKILDWENAKDYPTYPQLEELANIYRKPIAIFFFPQPPAGVEFKAEFRTISDEKIETLSHKVIRLINEALVMQLNLQELVVEVNSSDNILHNRLKNVSKDVLCYKTREYLNVSLERQFETQNPKEMFNIWRDAFYENGIYVFKEAFHDNTVSGFCIHDKTFPIIYVNNSMSFNRQIFTLFHELCHLVYQTGGVDWIHDTEDEFSSKTNKEIESLCNHFAANVLVPSESLSELVGNRNLTYEDVGKLAQRFCVSRESMIIRLIELQRLTWDFYFDHVDDFNNDFIRAQAPKPGGNSYYNLISYLGKHYLKLAFSAYRTNRINIFQLADYTKTKVSNLAQLENTWGGA